MKGASGFLSGAGAAGSLGGTINYVLKRPVDEPVREVSAGFATQSLWNLSADVGDRFGADRQFGPAATACWSPTSSSSRRNGRCAGRPPREAGRGQLRRGRHLQPGDHQDRLGDLPATLLLTVENVADRNHWASAQSGILTMADPRTVKLGLRLSL